jgi:hypothetical protein
MSGAALLRFPVNSVLRHVDPPTPPPSDVIDRGNSRLLLETARYVTESSKTLIEFMADNRRLARQMGIDTVIVELSGILASGKLDRIQDALEETVSLGAETKLTLEGLSYLKRAEKLVAETSLAMARITGDSSSARNRGLGGGLDLSLEDNSFTHGLILLGLVSIVAFTVIAVVFAVSKK